MIFNLLKNVSIIFNINNKSRTPPEVVWVTEVISSKWKNEGRTDRGRYGNELLKKVQDCWRLSRDGSDKPIWDLLFFLKTFFQKSFLYDSLYEDIVNHRNEDDELRLEKSCRKFLLAAREEGFNVDCGFYDLDEKIFKLEELGY